MQFELLINSSWGWWPLAAGTALAAALVLHFYSRERREVGPAKGAVLVILRLLLVLLVWAMLAQPALRRRQTVTQQRQLAVLLDDSLSMSIPDAQASPVERLRWADGVGLLAHEVRPVRPEALATQLRLIARATAGLSTELSELRLHRNRGNVPRQALVEALDRRSAAFRGLRDRLVELAQPLDEQAALRSTLPAAAQARWVDVNRRLASDVLAPAGELVAQLDALDPQRDEPAGITPLLDRADALAKASTAAAELIDGPLPAAAGQGDSPSLARAIDAAVAARLDAESRGPLDVIATMSREQLARTLLVSQGGDLLTRVRRSLGASADEQFAVKVVRFARTSGVLPPDQLARDSRPTTTAPAGEDATDPAGAVAAILAQLDGDDAGSQLAGVVILSDGQFNGSADLAAIARQRGLPIVPICIGGDRPPTDLAVVDLQTPDSLFKEDAANVVATVKLDGLSGRAVDVQLIESPQHAGEPGKVVQVRRITAKGASDRQWVEFNFKPSRVGVVSYQVTARPAGPPRPDRPADVLPANDSRAFAIAVTEEPTKVLVVDGPPRWETQYLINLLLRDKGTLVQHLYFSPATIQPRLDPKTNKPIDQRPPPKRASVKLARDKGVAEVDALPATVEELFAFDVVVLGDVAPADLPEGVQRDLERFVGERGGSLIVIAGKDAMPMRYLDRPLCDLLPVKPLPDAPTAACLEPFHVRLTEIGARSEQLRLQLDAEDNQRVWDRLPPSTWRQASLEPKPGATVLAYAQPTKAVAAGDAGPDSIASDSPHDLERRRSRQRPLMLVHNYGLGQVMFLAYDRTWQLRYKTGDRFHHKFWAQVIRWATASRLPGGSRHIKLGTDRARYAPGERITIRAKLTRDDFTPVNTAQLVAEVLQNDKVVARANLLPAAMADAEAEAGSAGQADSQPDTQPASQPQDQASRLRAPDGTFVATVGPLPGGQYNVSLKVIDAAGLSQEQRNQPVAVECFVEGDDPAEMLELSARPPVELADGGLVLSPSTAWLADQVFEEPVRRLVRHEDLVLWSSGWLLGLFLLIASAEWMLRKKFGLI